MCDAPLKAVASAYSGEAQPVSQADRGGHHHLDLADGTDLSHHTRRGGAVPADATGLYRTQPPQAQPVPREGHADCPRPQQDSRPAPSHAETRRINRARKQEIADRKWRNHMRKMLADRVGRRGCRREPGDRGQVTGRHHHHSRAGEVLPPRRSSALVRRHARRPQSRRLRLVVGPGRVGVAAGVEDRRDQADHHHHRGGDEHHDQA